MFLMKKIFKVFPNNCSDLIRFIKNRFNPEVKNGLYLTLGIIIVSFFSSIFLNLVEDLMEGPSLYNFDINLLNKIQEIRTPLSNVAMLYITYLGGWQVITSVSLLVVIIFIVFKRWKYIISLLVSLISGELFVYLVKNIIKRQRPSIERLLYINHDFSFPSGHTFTALVFYGLLTYFIFKSLKHKYLKALSILIGIILIASISFSRVYLEVHWPSDVFAGLASGTVFLTVVIILLEIKNKFRNPKA